MAKLTVKDVDLGGKQVFVRVDYNVPMKEKEGRMVVTDLTRVTSTLETLNVLIGQGAKVVLAAHLGRPKGKREPGMSLRPVADELAKLLGRPVAFVDDCIGEKVAQAVAGLKPGDVLLLENVRYYNEEEANDPAFAEQLAAVAEAYVNDGFGAAHRAHASTAGVARVVAARGGLCVAGLLMDKELRFLGQELEDPPRPFVVILGGAKVSDKIAVINRLLEKANTLLIGGAMTYTFKLAQGAPVGKSLVEPDQKEVAQAALDKAQRLGVKLLIPADDIAATRSETGEKDKKGRPIVKYENERVNTAGLGPDEAGVDIGPATIQAYVAEIAGAKSIVWNGPMGLFEDKRFSSGTFAVAQAVAQATQGRGALSIVGGGDSVTALNQAGLADKVTWVSTGGGASLEFLEGQVLPGVAALQDK
jgi:phosphoglycerate kinase